MPRIATKPSGLPKISSAAIMPIRPIGTIARTRNSLLKLCKLDHQESRHQEQHQRHAREHRACDLALSSTVPPVSMRYCGGRFAFISATAGASAATAVSGGDARRRGRPARSESACGRAARSAGFPARIRKSQLAQGRDAAVGQRDLQGLQRVERHALLVRRPRDDVDEIDVVTQLRDRSGPL